MDAPFQVSRALPASTGATGTLRLLPSNVLQLVMCFCHLPEVGRLGAVSKALLEVMLEDTLWRLLCEYHLGVQDFAPFGVQSYCSAYSLCQKYAPLLGFWQVADYYPYGVMIGIGWREGQLVARALHSPAASPPMLTIGFVEGDDGGISVRSRAVLHGSEANGRLAVASACWRLHAHATARDAAHCSLVVQWQESGPTAASIPGPGDVLLLRAQERAIIAGNPDEGHDGVMTLIQVHTQPSVALHSPSQPSPAPLVPVQPCHAPPRPSTAPRGTLHQQRLRLFRWMAPSAAAAPALPPPGVYYADYGPHYGANAREAVSVVYLPVPDDAAWAPCSPVAALQARPLWPAALRRPFQDTRTAISSDGPPPPPPPGGRWWLLAVKVTGDENVPMGQVTWRVPLGADAAPQAGPEGPCWRGWTQIASPGFRWPCWEEGTLQVLGNGELDFRRDSRPTGLRFSPLDPELMP